MSAHDEKPAVPRPRGICGVQKHWKHSYNGVVRGQCWAQAVNLSTLSKALCKSQMKSIILCLIWLYTQRHGYQNACKHLGACLHFICQPSRLAISYAKSSQTLNLIFEMMRNTDMNYLIWTNIPFVIFPFRMLVCQKNSRCSFCDKLRATRTCPLFCWSKILADPSKQGKMWRSLLKGATHYISLTLLAPVLQSNKTTNPSHNCYQRPFRNHFFTSSLLLEVNTTWFISRIELFCINS